MADLDRVSKILQETIDEFDAPGNSVAALLRKCQRIASLRGDAVNLAWLSLESQELVDDGREREHSDGLAVRLLSDLPDEVRMSVARNQIRAYQQRRAMPSPKGNIYGQSIQQIEERVRMLREQESALATPPQGMHPIDLAMRLKEHDKARMAFLQGRLPLEKVLARVRDALWEFLIETEWTLTFGEASAETFERLRSYVDQQLTIIAPPALEQFQAAYRRLNERTPEARAHAVTSCRRVLKTIADELYRPGEPAIGADGKSHPMTDDKFINRIAQFVFESVGSHQNGPVVQAAVADVCQRVAALNELASKGVHAEIGEYEVDSCVVQTYLVVADLLRIREQSQLSASDLSASPGTGS